MINPDSETETVNRPSFAPRILEGGLTLDLERLTKTMAMLEDYVDGMLALDEPLPLDPVIEEAEIQLRVASL
jgi:hypothetical protein